MVKFPPEDTKTRTRRATATADDASDDGDGPRREKYKWTPATVYGLFDETVTEQTKTRNKKLRPRRSVSSWRLSRHPFGTCAVSGFANPAFLSMRPPFSLFAPTSVQRTRACASRPPQKRAGARRGPHPRAPRSSSPTSSSHSPLAPSARRRCSPCAAPRRGWPRLAAATRRGSPCARSRTSARTIRASRITRARCPSRPRAGCSSTPSCTRTGP